MLQPRLNIKAVSIIQLVSLTYLFIIRCSIRKIDVESWLNDPPWTAGKISCTLLLSTMILSNETVSWPVTQSSVQFPVMVLRKEPYLCDEC
jgi:hypothetical protein